MVYRYRGIRQTVGSCGNRPRNIRFLFLSFSPCVGDRRGGVGTWSKFLTKLEIARRLVCFEVRRYVFHPSVLFVRACYKGACSPCLRTLAGSASHLPCPVIFCGCFRCCLEFEALYWVLLYPWYDTGACRIVVATLFSRR